MKNYKISFSKEEHYMNDLSKKIKTRDQIKNYEL